MNIRKEFIVSLFLTLILVVPLWSQAVYTTTAINVGSVGRTQLLAGVTSSLATNIVSLGVTVSSSSASANTFRFVYGSVNADTCTTGLTALTGYLTSLTTTSLTQGFISGLPVIVVPSSSALCIEMTGSQTVAGWFTWVRP